MARIIFSPGELAVVFGVSPRFLLGKGWLGNEYRAGASGFEKNRGAIASEV